MKTRYVLRDQHTGRELATKDSIDDCFQHVGLHNLPAENCYIVEQAWKPEVGGWNSVADAGCDVIEENNYQIPRDCYYE